MGFLEILITVFAAVLIGIIFYYVFKSTGPWGSLWSFILILVLAGVAAEAWIEPVGPVVWNVAWIPTLLVILMFALLLASASPPAGDRESSRGPNPSEEESAVIAIGGFFWIFLLALLAFILWGVFS